MRAGRWSRDARKRRLLALADVSAVVLATSLFAPGESGFLLGVATAPLWLLIAKALGNYDRDHRSIRHLTIDEVPQVTAWAAFGALVLSAFLSQTSAGGIDIDKELPLVLTAASAALLLRALVRFVSRKTAPAERTIIVGRGSSAEAIRRKLILLGDMNAEVVRRVDDPSFNGSKSERTEFLESLVADADRIILASASANLPEHLLGDLRVLCKDHQVKLSMISPLHGRAQPAPNTTQVADLRIIEFDTWDISRTTMILKRAFDLAISASMLVLFSPLMILVAVLIKLDSRGPVFFRQWRAGLDGRPFRMLKFRTMRRDAHERLADIVVFDELADPVFKLRSDPRVTRIGRVLRRFSLDEMPQLINVLRGQMSIVGPRPEQVELVERYAPEHRFRLEVKPGLTGPMQVNGRGNLTFAERLAVELDYIENLSLSRDLRLLALTVGAVVRRDGAY